MVHAVSGKLNFAIDSAVKEMVSESTAIAFSGGLDSGISRRITLLTTLAALRAAIEGLEVRQKEMRSVAPLQDYYAGRVYARPQTERP